MDRQLKAIVAGLVAGLSFLAPGVDDGLLWSEGIGAVLATLVGWQAVYWTSNRLDPDDFGADPDGVEDPEYAVDGHA